MALLATRDDKIAWKHNEITRYLFSELETERKELVTLWLSGGSSESSEYWRGAILTLDAVMSRIEGIVSVEESEANA